MNIYLKNYCKFLFTCKVVSIGDTQKYILNNEFDINEILSYFQECININDIFNLVHSDKFYKGHNLRDKYLLLIQFFNVIHNYSKNLILKFDVYSTKSIKKTTSNIKDCLIYIPHYENYLSALLGYIYDDEKSEWYIDNTMLNKNLLFAATCILCGYAHEKLTKIMDETNFTENDDGIESKNSTLPKKEKQWICKSCSISNDFKSMNCELCFHSREVELRESNKQPLINNLKKNQWKCDECTFINEITNNFCGACNSNKRLSYSLPISFLNDPQNKKQSVIVSEKISETVTHDQNKINTKKRRPPSDVNLMERQSSIGWNCTECTFFNKEENLNCETCSTKRQVKITDKRKKYSPENQIKEFRNSANKVKRSESEHDLIHRKPVTWSCEECTYLNKIENLNCEVCSKKRDVRTNSIHQTYPQHFRKNISTYSANGIKRSESEHVLIHRKPVTWSCEECTYLNKIENLNCEVCSKKRDVRTNSIHQTYTQNFHKKASIYSANDINTSTSHQRIINPQSHQSITPERNFNDGKENSKEINSKKPGARIESGVKNEPSKYQHNPHKSIGHPKKSGNNNNQHQPSNKHGSNTGKNKHILKNENRQLIPVENASNKNICKTCKKEKKKTHIKCKFRRFLCVA